MDAESFLGLGLSRLSPKMEERKGFCLCFGDVEETKIVDLTCLKIEGWSGLDPTVEDLLGKSGAVNLTVQRANDVYSVYHRATHMSFGCLQH